MTWSTFWFFDNFWHVLPILTIFNNFNNVEFFDNVDNFWQFLRVLTILTCFVGKFDNFCQCWHFLIFSYNFLTIFTIFTIFDNFWQFWQFLQFLQCKQFVDKLWQLNRQSWRLVTFETLITILAIENLNPWQSLLPDN